ncbi:MAG: LysE family transporter [Saprospiraceae bacterium]|nr:LysE family transporter [Saprospiraceae bacterium]
MTILIAGIFLSLMGSLPPGLISLSVAQTALNRGFASAMVLALGAAGAEFFQAIAAVWLIDWFLQHQAWARWFELGAAPVFVVLGVHLLFFAKPPRERAGDMPLHPGRLLFRGVLISAFNLLAIPYWFVYVGWLRAVDWWKAGTGYTVVFATGVMAGTLLALALYAWLCDRLLRRSAAFSRWANKVIGLIFLAMAVQLIFR